MEFISVHNVHRLVDNKMIANGKRALFWGQIMTPLSTQAYVPLLPIMVTLELRLSATIVGQLLSCMTFGVVLSNAALTTLLRRYSPRSVLLSAYALRAAAGCFWSLALILHGRIPLLPCLFLSRFMYGISLLSFSVTNPWIGIRLPVSDRPSALALASGFIVGGINLGPLVGNLISGISPTPRVSYVWVGWWTAASSAYLFLYHARNFSDAKILSGKADTASTNEKQNFRTWIVALSVVATSFLTGFSNLAAFEATESLMLFDGYGWDAAASARVFAPLGLLNLLVGMLVIPWTADNLNSAWLATLGFCSSAANLVNINWFDISEPVPIHVFYMCIFGTSLMPMLLNANLTAINVRLPASIRVQVNNYFQFSTQVGRLLGAVPSAYIYTKAKELIHGRGGGVNIERIYMSFPFFFQGVMLCCFFQELYGTFKDPSPLKRRQAES